MTYYATTTLWLQPAAKPGRSAHIADSYVQVGAGAQLTDEQLAMLGDIDRAIERGEVSTTKPAEPTDGGWVEHAQPDWTDASLA